MNIGVPIPLKSTIRELMQLDVLNSFSLGGGAKVNDIWIFKSSI